MSRIRLIFLVLCIQCIQLVSAVNLGDSVMSIAISPDNGTTFTAWDLELYTCSLGDKSDTFGGATETWGRSWTPSEFNNENFLARINLTGCQGTGCTFYADHIQVKVYYTLPAPALDFIAPTPVNNSEIGASLEVNVTADLVLDNCTLAYNNSETEDYEYLPLTLVNTTLCYGVKNFNNSLNITFFAFGTAEGGDQNQTEIRTVNTVTNPPNITLVTPLNNTSDVDSFRLLNISIIDDKADFVTIKIFGHKNISHLFESLLFIDFLKANNSYTYNWTAPTIDPNSEDLYAMYHFDNRTEFSETESNVFDFSGNNRNGTIRTGVINSSSKFGNGWYGEEDGGSAVAVKIGDGGEFNDTCINGCTFAAWVNKFTSGSNMIITRYDTSPLVPIFRFHVTSDKVQFIIGNGSAIDCSLSGDTSLDVTGATWYHVAGVFNTSDILVYLDGVKDGNKTCNIAVNQTAWGEIDLDTLIGANHILSPAQGQVWEGYIDEVGIWNRSLNETEIADLYRLSNGLYYWNATAQEDGQINDTELWQFYVGTCQYLGGNWLVDWEDNCTFNNETITLCDGCNLTITEITDTGTFTLDNATIRNINQWFISGGIQFLRTNGARLLFGY